MKKTKLLAPLLFSTGWIGLLCLFFVFSLKTETITLKPGQDDALAKELIAYALPEESGDVTFVWARASGLLSSPRVTLAIAAKEGLPPPGFAPEEEKEGVLWVSEFQMTDDSLLFRMSRAGKSDLAKKSMLFLLAAFLGLAGVSWYFGRKDFLEPDEPEP